MLNAQVVRCVGVSTLVISACQSAVCHAEEVRLHIVPAIDDERRDPGATQFVSPQSALAALPAIAKQSPDADIRILLHGGVYRIEKPLKVLRHHVPEQGSLTFASANGEKVVISGGKPITDWTIKDDGTWSTVVTGPANGSWVFRELFFDGQRRPRARHPNAGFVRVEKAFDDKRSGFTFAAGDLPRGWIEGGEVVFLHDWSTSRIPVQRIEHDARRLTVVFPIGSRSDHFRIDHFEPHPRYYVEGHREFLDAPGEWLLDVRGELNYRPLAGETPETTSVIAPFAGQLLVVQGDDEGPIRDVHFEGLHFEHCGWQLPEQGFAGSQATAHDQRGERTANASRRLIPAAIHFELAEDCSFTKGSIRHMGTSGIEFGSRTKRCRLEDCVVEDISGNGVNLGEDTSRSVNGQPWWQSAPDEVATGNIVRHNGIERCGQQFFGAVGIWAGLTRGTQVANNEIAHLPYTGVSLGWMWNPQPTPAGENIVSQNHIHHIMQVLSDGGGIYTLGRQPGTRLVGNLIHDVPRNAGRAESNGMFLDEGSDQMEIAHNTIYGVDRSPLRFHRAFQLKVQDNTLVVPSSDTPPLAYNNTDPQTIVQLTNRVVPAKEFDPAATTVPATGPRRDSGQR
jgi:hypothetical protein